MGIATFMHGYAARLGLGITLIRNHIKDANPIRQKGRKVKKSGFFKDTILPFSVFLANNFDISLEFFICNNKKNA